MNQLFGLQHRGGQTPCEPLQRGGSIAMQKDLTTSSFLPNLLSA